MKRNVEGIEFGIGQYNNQYFAYAYIDIGAERYYRYFTKSGTWGYCKPEYFPSKTKLKRFLETMAAFYTTVPEVLEVEEEEREEMNRSLNEMWDEQPEF